MNEWAVRSIYAVVCGLVIIIALLVAADNQPCVRKSTITIEMSATESPEIKGKMPACTDIHFVKKSP